MALTALLAAVEICFISQNYSDYVFSNLIKAFVPTWMTYREFFDCLQLTLPYVILIIISVFDIFKYKTFEWEIHESGDVVCSRSIEIQEEIL